MTNNEQRPAGAAGAPVVISGGGPSGLFLALDLAQRGIESVLIEPRQEIDRLRPRAKTTNARTMTHLRRLGLADALRQAAPLPTSYSQDVIFCSTLTGYEITRFHEAFQLAQGPYRWQPECGQQIPQPLVEEVLRAAVAKNPLITTWFGYRTSSVRQLEGTTAFGSPQHEVTAENAHGTTLSIRADFVVGADGASSVVRKSMGIPMVGGSAALSNVSAVFTSSDLARTVELDPAVQYWVLSEGVCGMIGPMDLADSWWAIIQGADGNDPDFDAASSIRTMVGADIDLQIQATDPWTARMLLASSYGRDGIFLVGDAAHLNPPWGGHGFNTCIGDASNLAWKLAAVLHGWAPPALLASYELERRQVAERTIAEAAQNGKSLAYDFASALLNAPGSEADAARASAQTHLQVKASEFHSLGLVLGYHYAGSPIIAADGSEPPASHPISYTPSTAPGCLLPHAWLAPGSCLYDQLGQDFTLLIDQHAAEADGAMAIEEIKAAAGAAGLPLAVRVIDTSFFPAESRWAASAVLIRPDQHVGWQGDDLAGVMDALRLCLGNKTGSLV
ncbi:FAD-dependent monooxygenase [Glutamicibacter sp. JL.03c]|uniref:FAD-dependent monooxygenase n=1 Tax=Glutamicibacter sp. JL.03c TaxID=2984842 RepID=UPI0021F701F0|nr:FAD-dependent monooxygenase [Glutamicibacter sp. JL.03c]UYQ77275.1 FAD-dependent monooxygenase [Glutamicibacter sp. JL.03c]